MDTKKANILFFVVILLIAPFILRYLENRPMSPWIIGPPAKDVRCADEDTTVTAMVRNLSFIPENKTILEVVDEVKDANGLDSDEVFTGQCIEIMVFPVSYRWKQYRLREGEYPYLIAERIKRPDYKSFDDVLEMIIIINNLTEESATNLPVGHPLILPEFQL